MGIHGRTLVLRCGDVERRRRRAVVDVGRLAIHRPAGQRPQLEVALDFLTLHLLDIIFFGHDVCIDVKLMGDRLWEWRVGN